MFKIYNDSCFNVFPKIEANSIDLVLVDLPYGQTACEWDVKIDLENMWKELKRICKYKCIYVFFTTTKYGNELINSRKKWFAYDLVWQKSSNAGFLQYDKLPLRRHEMIYVFKNSSSLDDIEMEYNKELRQYSRELLKYMNITRKKLHEDFQNYKWSHFFSFNSIQYGLCTKQTYNKLIELYKIDEWGGFKPYKELQKKYEKVPGNKKTYNPQKTKGRPYKVKEHKIKNKNKNVYDIKAVPSQENKTGDRFPISIIKFNHDKEKLHPTQKPVKLCEWLIKTYSNENDIILDFVMGSGTCYIACKNTNRQFIGIEKDKDIFEIAEERILRQRKL